MANESKAVVYAQGVCKTYKMGKHDVAALKNIDLTIEPGEFMALAGTSGSGKTTFLNLLGCLDRPTRGEIYIDGIAVNPLTNAKLSKLRAKKIGYVFQHFNLIPTLTALENVEYPLHLLPDAPKNRTEQAKEALRQVGLLNFIHHRPAQLSGGQQQRVAIARAIVKKPALVLADEPTAALDRKTAQEVLTLMRTLNRESGITFVLSSHDSLVLNFADRVFTLVDGEVASDNRRNTRQETKDQSEVSRVA